MMITPAETRSNVLPSSHCLLENHKVPRARKDTSSSGTPHSLIISPNLDALLEFDRKARGIQSTPVESSPLLSASTLSIAAEGLPLPPRRRSRPNTPRSPTSPRVSSPLVQLVIEEKGGPLASGNVTIQNPFINSPPPLEMLVGEDLTRTEGGGEEEPRDRQKLQGLDDMIPDGDRRGPSEHLPVRSQQSVNLPSMSVTVATKSRVDKLLGIGKNPFGLFSEPNDTEKTSPSFQSAVPNLKERAKATGKLLKLVKDSATMINGSQQSGISWGNDNDTSPPDHDRERWVEPHSHDNPTVSPSRPSLDSISSSSSSTVDYCISISSTINPSSSGHAYTDMYYTPVIPPHRTSSLYDSVYPGDRNSDRESFIDMMSPIIPEFATSTRSDDVSLPTPTSSPKPPLPITPKPIFDRLPAGSSSTPRYGDSRSPAGKLPPTTNFLDLDERSELLRKNRKIAQVLGQSPGPDVLVHPDVSVRASRMLLPPSLSSNSHIRETPTLDNAGRIHSSSNINRVNNKVSRESFIDLSDDSGSAPLTTPKEFGHGRPPSPSQQSIFENMTEEEQAEELRRRKREKLAKLHRFLGSRVPADLVLGLERIDSPLPLPPPLASAALSSPMSVSSPVDSDDGSKRVWVRRRRSSSAAILPSTWSDEVDRIKEDLNAREKAVNVRRAQKMEKMFGVAPPQILYHTRHSPSPSVGNTLTIASNKFISGWTSPGENHPPVTGQRNPNRSSYTKQKKQLRPGTSDSSKALLPKNRGDPANFDDSQRRLSVYSHYQESLRSLNDIIDRDDRTSLAELHEYLNSADTSFPLVTAVTRSGSGERRLSTTSSVKSERRHSLPTRTSMISLASEYSVSTPKPEVTDFQARRRRAAKLTQFFGVDYRELITDVLESIEHGLEHERKRGTLNPEEVQDLQAKLRKLRVKREGFF